MNVANGGLHIALEYFIAGLILMITIIGIPFGIQSMKLGMLAIWPFGTKVKWKPSQPGCLSIFMNVLRPRRDSDRTDGVARAKRNSFQFFRVTTEEDKVK